MYGQHEHCGDWCKSKGGKDKGHSNLPHGIPLVDIDARLALDNLIAPYIKNVQKLMTTGTSQTNESLNNVAWSKAPKSRNYNRSESFDFRMSTAVLQFNEGYSYLSTAVDGLSSPSKETTNYSCKMDQTKKRQRIYKTTTSAKKRRTHIKTERHVKEKTCAIKEGITYQSGCLIDETVEPDICEIPDTVRPSIHENADINLIYVDIETTTVGPNAEMTQLAAQYTDAGGNMHTFNKYIMPIGYMSNKASEITGIHVRTVNGIRKLFKHEHELNTANVAQALHEFILWVKSLQINNAVLTAHNGKAFDFRIIFTSLRTHGLLMELNKCIYGYVDSYQMLRKVRPNFEYYSMTKLYEALFDSEFPAHDAVEDTAALGKILSATNICTKEMLPFIMSFEEILVLLNQGKIQRELSNQLGEHGVTSYMMKKLARSGLSYKHLQMANNRDPNNGLRLLLSEKVKGKARVTNKKAIIQKIKNALS